MASHFSTIGFEVATKDDLRGLIERAIRTGESFTSPHGRYVRWDVGEGIELWVGVDEEESLATAHPHFSGAARMEVGITEGIVGDPEIPLEGSFHGWAGGLPGTGCYPFLFDAPNFDCFSEIRLPALRTVQLAGFAHEVSVYRDDQHFAERPDDLRVAAESFIPTGLFLKGEDVERGPESKAALSGHILSFCEITNPIYGKNFWSIRVRTYGGILDVVADPRILEGSPAIGGVVYGLFWLSGRILD